MNKDTFNKYYHSLLRKASKVRDEKEEEYLSENDVLSSFRRIARFRERTTPQSIADQWAKHADSISTMVNEEFEHSHAIHCEQYPLEKWDEKFIDLLNLTLKLYVAIQEHRTTS